MNNIDWSALASFSLGALSLERVLEALLTLAVCLVAAKLLLRLVDRLLRQPHFDPRLRRFAMAGAKVLLYVVTVLIVADSLGIPVTSLVTMLGVFGLAVSLALQDVLANVASGLVILFAKPFLIGDYIESDIGAGTVAAIDLIHTKLDTADGQRVLLPNSKLSASRIINYTSLGTRRIDLTLGAPYGVPAERVRAACLAAVAATPDILADPAPSVVLTEFGDSAVQYHLRCWTQVSHYWDSRYRLAEEIQTAFDRAGISMPFSQLDVHIVP